MIGNGDRIKDVLRSGVRKMRFLESFIDGLRMIKRKLIISLK